MTISILLALFVGAISVRGQVLRFGVTGGQALTNDYATGYSFNPMDGALEANRPLRFKHFILGPTVELSLTPSFAIEVNGLFRTLRQDSSNSITWEFPVLAKYRLKTGFVQPFLEAGPEFRTTDSVKPGLSHFGITAGAGVEFQTGRWRFAPVIRYTRWGEGSGDRGSLSFKRDQIEVLGQISYASTSRWHPWGKRVTLGMLAGTTMTDDFFDGTRTFVVTQISPVMTTFDVTEHRTAIRSLIIGPTFKVELPRKFFVEIDGLYRPLRRRFSSVSESPAFNRPPVEIAASIWEVPILGGYQFGSEAWRYRPFVEGGASFRFPRTSSPDHGVVIGAGIEARVGALRIGPTVRYTRWLHVFDTLENQVEVFFGISF